MKSRRILGFPGAAGGHSGDIGGARHWTLGAYIRILGNPTTGLAVFPVNHQGEAV